VSRFGIILAAVFSVLSFSLAGCFQASAQEPADSVAIEMIPDENPAEILPIEDQVIEYAKSFLGTPYRLGAVGPIQFDCSSYTRYVFRHFGYDIPGYSASQFRCGTKVESYSDLRKGDLVFFGKRGDIRKIGHVGIVVEILEEQGSFSFIHASVTGGVVIQQANHPYFMMRYMGARRILEQSSDGK